jgi:hypothetical protein
MARALSPPGINYADTNAQGSDRWTRIKVNLYLCFSVLMNLARAAVPAPSLSTAETPNLLAGLEGFIVRLGLCIR